MFPVIRLPSYVQKIVEQLFTAKRPADLCSFSNLTKNKSHYIISNSFYQCLFTLWAWYKICTTWLAKHLVYKKFGVHGKGLSGIVEHEPQSSPPTPSPINMYNFCPANNISESLAESAAAYTKATARKCLLEKVEVITGEEAESNVLQVSRH